MPKTYRIGDLAREMDVPVETIRYYERERLLPEPDRTAGNYRLYGDSHREHLSFIRHCRSLDMTLQEIRQLQRLKNAPGKTCEEVNNLLDAHISHVAERIAALRRLQRHLHALRDRCGSARLMKDCKILTGLSSGHLLNRKGPRGGHVGGAHRG